MSMKTKMGLNNQKTVADYGIQVDFAQVDEDNMEDLHEAIPRLDKEIADKIAEIERMASKYEGYGTAR